MDIRKVKKLIELLESSDIAEIEIKEGEEAVRISRYSKHHVNNCVTLATGAFSTSKNAEDVPAKQVMSKG